MTNPTAPADGGAMPAESRENTTSQLGKISDELVIIRDLVDVAYMAAMDLGYEHERCALRTVLSLVSHRVGDAILKLDAARGRHSEVGHV